MQTNHICPKCSGKKIWRIEKVAHETGLEGGGSLRVVFERHIGDPDRTIIGTGAPATESAGHYDVYACARCGYAEWYARDLERLCENIAEGVTLIEEE